MADLEIAVALVGRDQLSQPITQAQAALRGLGNTAEGSGRQLGSFWSTIERGMTLGVGFGVGLRAIEGAMSAVAGMARNVGEAVFGSNSRLEQATVTFESFTRSAGAAQQIMDALRHEADITPFDTSEVVDAGKALIASAHGSRDALLGLVRTAEVLAALRPEQGLRGAAVALQEATAGQFESVIDRFNLSREAINRFAAQGKTGIEIVRAALAEMGADASLVERLGQTFEGRKSTIAAFFAEFERRLGEGVFTRVSEAMGRMVAFIARHGDELQATASRIGAVVGALFERLAETVGGAAQRLLNALLPGLGDRIAQEWQATAAAVAQIGPAAQGATPAAQALAHALTLPEARQALEAATSQVDKLKSLAAQIEPPIKQVDRALAGVGIQAAEVQLQANRVKQGYDDQLAPLERQLRLLQESSGLLEANARAASAHAQQELLTLDRQIARMARRVGTRTDPDAPDLTPRQRMNALRLDELRAQREGLGLEESRRGVVLSLTERVNAIKQAQADALRPLEQQLQMYRDQADVLNLQRERWQLLKQDIDAAVGAANAIPKSLPVGGPDDAEVAARQGEMRAAGEKIAGDLVTSMTTYVEAHGGTIWAALGTTLDTWYATTGRAKFSGMGEDLGAAMGSGLVRGVDGFLGSLVSSVVSIGPTLGKALHDAIAEAIANAPGTRDILDLINWLRDKRGPTGPPGEPTISARAGGGPVSSGMPYLVGERGAELFVPGQSGAILPTGAASIQGGSVTINVYQTLNATVRGEADEQRLARLAAEQNVAAIQAQQQYHAGLRSGATNTRPSMLAGAPR